MRRGAKLASDLLAECQDPSTFRPEASGGVLLRTPYAPETPLLFGACVGTIEDQHGAGNRRFFLVARCTSARVRRYSPRLRLEIALL